MTPMSVIATANKAESALLAPAVQYPTANLDTAQKQNLQEEQHEQVRQWMYSQTPQTLAPLLRQANLTERRLGENPVSEQGLTLALQQAELLYERQKALQQAPIAYILLLHVLNQRFAKDEVTALSNRFLTYLRSAGESAVHS